MTEDEKDKRIAELEARLRPGVSTILNDLIAADFAHVNPVTGEISLTFHGQLLVDKSKEFQQRSKDNN
jgi:predicted ATPase with chaperone activity